jgi:phosphoglycerate kinase
VRRFTGDVAFAKLASLGDVYVNDAFGTAHRALQLQLSLFPTEKCFQLLANKGIESLNKVLKSENQ